MYRCIAVYILAKIFLHAFYKKCITRKLHKSVERKDMNAINSINFTSKYQINANMKFEDDQEEMDRDTQHTACQLAKTINPNNYNNEKKTIFINYYYVIHECLCAKREW